jgi:hypothetical protein
MVGAGRWVAVFVIKRHLTCDQVSFLRSGVILSLPAQAGEAKDLNR